MSKLLAKVHLRTALIVVTILLLIIHTISAAPNVCITATVKSEEKNDPGIISYVTSKTLGAVVKAASYVCQWLPQLPEWMRPSKPKMRFIRPSGKCARIAEISLEDFD